MNVGNHEQKANFQMNVIFKEFIYVTLELYMINNSHYLIYRYFYHYTLSGTTKGFLYCRVSIASASGLFMNFILTGSNSRVFPSR